MKKYLLLFLLLSTWLCGAAEFKKFTSNGNAKANGLDFSFKYPSDWREGTAESANIVCIFLNSKVVNQKAQSTSISVVVKKLEGNLPTPEDQAKFHTREMMQTLMPPGSRFHAYRKAKLAGDDASFFEFETIQEREGRKLYMQASACVLIHENYMIMLQGYATALAANDAKVLYKASKTTLGRIINSLEFQKPKE